MTLKTHADKSTHSTLREKRNQERADWTPASSRGDDLSVAKSRRCVVLGRRVSQDNRDAHHGGHDE